MWCHITYLPTSMMDKVMAKLMVSLFNLSTVCWARPWNRRNIIWSDAVWHWQCSSQPEPGSSTERQACTVSATPPIWPVRQFNESDLAIAKVALFLDLLSLTELISCPWKKRLPNLKDILLGKQMLSFRHCLNYLSPPPPKLIISLSSGVQ